MSQNTTVDIIMINVKYNMFIIDEIFAITNNYSKTNLLSKSIRQRAIEKGLIDSTKVQKLHIITGIDEEYLNGKLRFYIPYSEEILEKDPLAIAKYVDSLPKIKFEIKNIVDSVSRGEIIEDINLERIIYYLLHDFNMEGYQHKEVNIKTITTALINMDNKRFLNNKNEDIKRFIKVANDKITIAKAALILNRDTIKKNM